MKKVYRPLFSLMTTVLLWMFTISPCFAGEEPISLQYNLPVGQSFNMMEYYDFQPVLETYRREFAQSLENDYGL